MVVADRPDAAHVAADMSGDAVQSREADQATSRVAQFERIFNMHYTAVERYITHRHDSVDRADVLSVTFTTAWRRLDDCPCGDSDVRGWLIGIARNTARNTARSHRRRHAAETTSPAARRLVADLYDVSVPADTAARVAHALGQLRDTDREVVELAAYYGLTGSALAAALGVNVNVANVRLHRARQRLTDAYRAAAGEESR